MKFVEVSTTHDLDGFITFFCGVSEEQQKTINHWIPVGRKDKRTQTSWGKNKWKTVNSISHMSKKTATNA